MSEALPPPLAGAAGGSGLHLRFLDSEGGVLHTLVLKTAADTAAITAIATRLPAPRAEFWRGDKLVSVYEQSAASLRMTH
jgi:hypothetical protein